ncbi:MAG: flagellar export protein FliJ [bacterium]
MFKFRLEAVEKYREFLEEQKKMELAEKQRIYFKEKQRGDVLREMRLQYHEAMRTEAAKEDVSVSRMSFFQSYIFVIEKRIITQDERIRAAKIQMAKAQQALIEAKRGKEVMVRAREHAFKKYQYAEGLAYQKMLDDVSTIKHIRASKGLDPAAMANRMF